jgi:hypothetical protein
MTRAFTNIRETASAGLVALTFVALGPLGGCTGRIAGAGVAGGSPGSTGSSSTSGVGGAGSAATPPPVPVPASQLPQGTSGPINPGRVVAHRLNKVEYDNTIRDLIGLDLKPSATFGFPDDTYIEGFDNNADALTASPLLLEKYQAATDAVVQAALSTAAVNAAVRARIITCDPAKAGDAVCANQVLTAFATRAWRRPVVASEIAPYAGLLSIAKSLGDGFDQAMSAALQAMLLSPKFLFRVETNPGAGKVAVLGDYEIASRLSYFLWSSMPDDALFASAAAGTLHQPDEIGRQVARLLLDPKGTALVSNLSGEWLGSRELAVQQITLTDVVFDQDLRAAMAQEASLYLHEMLTGTHPIADLLKSDFAFVNQRLATHYGLPGATTMTAAFQRVTLPDDRRGAGILTQANTLTVLSLRDRTSPTRRGKWISENLLCVVVPPPPPQIPQLTVNNMTAPTSARERLVLHRQKGSACAACHQLIDPMGLALEHYDTVGRWRDTDLGAAIDTTGAIPITSVPFDGAVNLAQALREDARFTTCIVRKMLTYALGRSLVLSPAPGDEFNDQSGVDDLRMRAVGSASGFSQLMDVIARSPFMTMRIGDVQP